LRILLHSDGITKIRTDHNMHDKRYSAEIEKLRSPERIKRLEIEKVANIVLEGIVVGTVLDVGTGSGIFAEEFYKRGKSVTGIDPNPEMLKSARKFIPEGNFQDGTVESIPADDKSFDLVFLGLVLHESDDLAKALNESKRCARYRVGILEWQYKQEESGPPIEHRLRPEEIIAFAERTGFSKIETIRLDQLLLYRLTN
jgi:ubiquinone/menaquinone biosynthesis C-methylase UbiE